ncbi:integron gene cassette protein [mine drainage metagenome]|uniref:Integron gene cassette protein n=1 Tax=mine drainage metagenome TaxID=410659 RepID=T1CSA6_9ZZZZ
MVVETRKLTETGREKAARLLERVRAELMDLSGEEPQLLFARRRKIAKELVYDERSGPTKRKSLKRSEPIPPSCDNLNSGASYSLHRW